MTTSTHSTRSTATTAEQYNYAAFVQRHDAHHPAAALHPIRAVRPSPEAVHNDERDAVISAIVSVWDDAAVPDEAIAVMAGVLTGLFDHLEATGRPDASDLTAASEDELVAFVTTNPTHGHRHTPGASVTDSEMQLRRNVVNGALLALAQLDVIEYGEPLEVPALAHLKRSNLRGKCKHNPLETKTRNSYDQRTHNRPATHDEVLITRIASRLAGTRTSRHLCTAVVALITSTAAVAEVPQVLWMHRNHSAVTLPGYTRVGGAAIETQMVARTVTLDPWAAVSLDLWRAECDNYRRRPDSTDSMTYTGRQELTSTSAKATTDQHLRNATKLAGLDQVNGLTATSYRLWAAVKDSTDRPSAVDAAARAGLRLPALHRTLHQLGERAL